MEFSVSCEYATRSDSVYYQNNYFSLFLFILLSSSHGSIVGEQDLTDIARGLRVHCGVSSRDDDIIGEFIVNTVFNY